VSYTHKNHKITYAIYYSLRNVKQTARHVNQDVSLHAPSFTHSSCSFELNEFNGALFCTMLANDAEVLGSSLESRLVRDGQRYINNT
jgi:hypothetical protein